MPPAQEEPPRDHNSRLLSDWGRLTLEGTAVVGDSWLLCQAGPPGKCLGPQGSGEGGPLSQQFQEQEAGHRDALSLVEPQLDSGSLRTEVSPQQWCGCEWGLGRHSGLELGGLASLLEVLGSWQVLCSDLTFRSLGCRCTCNVQGQEVDHSHGLELRRFLLPVHQCSRILSHDCGHGSPEKVTQVPGQPCSTWGLIEQLLIAHPAWLVCRLGQRREGPVVGKAEMRCPFM